MTYKFGMESESRWGLGGIIHDYSKDMHARMPVQKSWFR